MNSKNRSRLVASVAVLTLMLAMIAPAAYAKSGGDGYRAFGPSVLDQTAADGPAVKSGTSPSNTQSTVKPDPSSTQRTASSEALPFTGLDLGIVAVAGGSLVLLGFGMRRLTRATDTV